MSAYMSLQYWQRAQVAIDRRRKRIKCLDMSEDSPEWRQLARLAWLERYAQACLELEQQKIDIF